MEKEPAKLREAIQLLEFERETWVMLMDKNKASGPDAGCSPSARRRQPLRPADRDEQLREVRVT